MPTADVIATIRELHRERQDYHNAEKGLTLRIKAIQRRMHARSCAAKKHAKCVGVYDSLPAAALVLSDIRAQVEPHRKRPEKELKKLATLLPVWPWVEGVHGFGALGLAQIVAECGDLTAYANPAKLWTRMGVGRYRRTDGTWSRQCKADGENGVLAKYAPHRRAIVFVIGDCIIKAGGPFREHYDTRKLLEQEKPSCGPRCEDASRPGHCAPIHIHRRAKRWMEKKLLKHLWRQWRAAYVPTPSMAVPAAVAEAEA